MESRSKDSNDEEQKTNQDAEHNELGGILKHDSILKAVLRKKQS